MYLINVNSLNGRILTIGKKSLFSTKMASKLITSIFRLLLLGVPFVFLFFPDKWSIKFDYPYAGLVDNFYVRLAKAMFLLLVLVELLRMFYYGVIKNPKGNKLVANLATLAIMVVWLVGLLEITFMFISQSHEGDLSKASQIWFAKYWKPITSEGYRDFPKNDAEKRKKYWSWAIRLPQDMV